MTALWNRTSRKKKKEKKRTRWTLSPICHPSRQSMRSVIAPCSEAHTRAGHRIIIMCTPWPRSRHGIMWLHWLFAGEVIGIIAYYFASATSRNPSDAHPATSRRTVIRAKKKKTKKKKTRQLHHIPSPAPRPWRASLVFLLLLFFFFCFFLSRAP